MKPTVFSSRELSYFRAKSRFWSGFVKSAIWLSNGMILLLMEEILHQLRSVVYPNYLQGFILPRWLFGISSINGIILGFLLQMYCGFSSIRRSLPGNPCAVGCWGGPWPWKSLMPSGNRGGSIVNVDNFSFNMKIPAFARMNRGTSLRIFRNIFLRNIGTETCESKQIIKTTQAAGMTC